MTRLTKWARRSGARGRAAAVGLCAGALALSIGGVAIAQQSSGADDSRARASATNGDPFLLGRTSGSRANPITGSTKLFSSSTDYALRESNLSTTGGGAIHGCRTGPAPVNAASPGPKPCLRANNLSNGEAFQFQATNGNVGGRIQVGGSNLAQVNPNAIPFVTNAAGRVPNLNADKVDGLDAEQLKGEKGATGPQGPPGIAATHVVTETTTVPVGSTEPVSVEASCHEGEAVTGGGFSASAPGLDLVQDAPATGEPAGWVASAANPTGADIELTVHAVCSGPGEGS